MDIKKLQSGGTPTIEYFANPNLAGAASNKSTSTSDSGLISQDLIEKLGEKGIPVDVDNLLDQISDLEYKQSLGIPISSRIVRKIEAQINRVVQQATYLQKAEDRAQTNDALGEIAVGDRGELFVVDGQDIKKVSIGDYNIEKHGPALTVNELIEQRKFNPTQAYDTDITTAIGNNIGMSKISDYIQKIVASVGSSETSSEAYIDLAGIVGREAVKRPSEVQLQTIQQLSRLAQTMGMDAIFKETNFMKQENVKDAFAYIQSVLPSNMRKQLQARFVANGYSLRESQENVGHLIGQALMAGNDTKQEYKIDYDNTSNSAVKSQSRNLGVLEQLVQGSLGKRDYKLMSTKNPEFSLNLHGTGVGNMATFNNNIVGKTPLSIVLDSGLAPLVDENHITVGNQKLPSGAFDTILYYGQDIMGSSK